MKKILEQKIIDKYILYEFGEIPNPPTKDEMSELIYNDKLTLEVIKLWSLFGGDLMIKENSQGDIILHSASYMGQLDIIQYVLDKGVGVDYLNHNKVTSLIYASCKGHIEVIDLLLDSGANINHQDIDDYSTLHYACQWNQLEVVKVLIERGINIHLKGNFIKKYKTALDIAKRLKHQEIVDYLTPYYII